MGTNKGRPGYALRQLELEAHATVSRIEDSLAPGKFVTCESRARRALQPNTPRPGSSSSSASAATAAGLDCKLIISYKH